MSGKQFDNFLYKMPYDLIALVLVTTFTSNVVFDERVSPFSHLSQVCV